MWVIPTGAKYPDLGWELTRYVLSNPAIQPTIASMGSLFPGRLSFAKWGLPPMWETKIPNAYEVFLEASLEKPDYFGYFPLYDEWEPLWGKWMDPVFVEGDPDVEAALEGLQAESNALLAGG